MQPKVTARNNSDPAFQTDYKLREAATCFARAGDCVAAWHAAKEQAQAFADHAGRKSDDELSRSFMTDATKDLCTGKDQGTLTDSETFYRDMAELSGVSRDAPPAPGFCNERVTLAQAALSRIMQGPQASAFKDARAPERLFASASQCLATSGDCAGAWHTALDLERKWAGPDNTDPDARARGHFRDRAPACALKPQGAMGPRDTVFWAAGVLQDATRSGGDAGVCRGALGAALRAAPADPEDRSVNTPWHYATRDIPRYAGRCLRAAQDCGAAWAIYQDAYPVFGYPQSTDVRRMFESDVSDCKGK
jgi:hypothetical protein